MRKWTKPETEEDDSPKSENGMCMCYGCPLTGTISRSTTGPTTDWMCAAHIRTEPGDWHEVTRRLNSNHLVVSLMLDIRRMLNGKDVDMRGWLVSLKSNGLDQFLPSDDDRRSDGSLSMRKWLYRIERMVYTLANSGLNEAQNDGSNPVTRHTESVMTLVDEWLKKHHTMAKAA